MVEVFQLPLFAALVGLAFTVGFGPWLARRWQDRQREREIRNELVADMSRCIMNLVAVLERRHPGTRAAQAGPLRSPESETELAKAILTFDIDRCVIGTRLEAYFPRDSLAGRWTTFADELILFSAGSEEPGLEKRLYRDSPGDSIWAMKKAGAEARAKDREDWVGADWGAMEQLFLVQKLELINSVHNDTMEQPRYPESSIRFFMWSSISIVSAILAFIGSELASQDHQSQTSSSRRRRRL